MRRFLGKCYQESIKITKERMQDALPWGSAFFYGENPWIIKYSQKIFR